MKKIVLENQVFSSDVCEKTESKFNGLNALGFSWRPGQEMFSLEIKSCKIDGLGVAEGLKLSFCRNVKVIDSTIIGGYEDCVDIVRGENITFENCDFIANSGTKQHITCKCGAKNIVFKNCNFIGSFRNWWDGACIDLGNWGDYDDVDRPKVRGVSIINCKLKNVMFPILYRRLYSNTPRVKSSSGFGLRVPNIFVKIFWLLQRKELIGKRRRFPENWLKVYDFEL
jgi:hypothetical protein